MSIPIRMLLKFLRRFDSIHRRGRRERRGKIGLFGIALLFCLLLSKVLQAEATLLSPELDQHCKAGFQALYSMDYANAKKEFEQITKADPKHPAGYVYLASAVWLEHLASLRRLQSQLYNRNDAFFRASQEPVSPQLEKLFYSNIEKGIARAEMKLRKNNKDLAALYYLGTAHGAIAGYESTVKRAFVSSLRNGTKAVEMHKKVLKLDPAFADAYVSVGMYNYVVGSVPFAVKILLMIGGVRGSKEEGLKQLEKAASEAIYARDEASVILALLYDRQKRYEEAFKLLQELAGKYPRNFVFRFETAGMLTKTGHIAKSMAIYEALMKEEPARNYMLDLLHFEYAEILFASQNWHQAYEHYLMARRVMDKTPEGLIAMTHLKAGLCLNAMRKDSEASIEYRFVLNQRNFNHSHELAKQYLKQPFHP